MSCCPVTAEPARDAAPSTGVLKKVGQTTIYVTGPATATAGVLALPDIFGLDSGRSKADADALGRLGYAVVLVDLTDGDYIDADSDYQSTLGAWFGKYSFETQFSPRINDAVQYLKTEVGVQRVASYGYCWGSWVGATLTASAEPLVTGHVSFHPTWIVENLLKGDGAADKLAERVKVPQLLLAAGDDPAFLKPEGSVHKILAARSDIGAQSNVLEFPTENHGWVHRGDLEKPATTEAARARPKLKAAHHVHCAELETLLVRWISRCEKLQLPVATWATIRAKAEKLRSTLLLKPDREDADRLKRLAFSDGWLQKLQARHGFKPRRVHGEAASASKKAVEEGREALRGVTSQYKPRDIFNMDESAYFYCAIPSSTIVKTAISGRKAVKKRLTVALTTNADGSIKVPLLFVGTVKQPRCFGKSSAAELGVDYAHSPKGWMTTALFQSWLDYFNGQMRNEGRHVLLLLDNASPHRVVKAMSNVALHFLPPNTTAHLQPQDAGVIQAFKSHLLKIRMASIVDKRDVLLEREDAEPNEQEVAHLYEASVLDAMRWAQEAWDAVSPDTVANCWRHTGILAEDIFELVARIDRLRVVLDSIE